jgi:hypothetical protein
LTFVTLPVETPAIRAMSRRTSKRSRSVKIDGGLGRSVRARRSRAAAFK